MPLALYSVGPHGPLYINPETYGVKARQCVLCGVDFVRRVDGQVECPLCVPIEDPDEELCT